MKLEITADGSHSLRHTILGELYHSDRGAVGEAMHVYVEAGFNHFAMTTGQSRIAVLEVGFGSGLNAWLTMQRASEMGIAIDYHSVELYPVEMDIAASLNFTNDASFMDLHRAAWDVEVGITDNFTLTKHLCDWTKFQCPRTFDVVYYDAFAPEVQPTLWSGERFGMLFDQMNQSGVVTTYTAKGVVKEAMRSAGFTVERLTGALGKRHMVRGTKKEEG